MVATRADRLRFPAHWDDSETCAVVEDSAVSCSSATDLPGATPMTAYHCRHHLYYPRSSSSSSSLHPKSPSRQQRLRRLSRLQQQRGLVSRAGDLEQACRGRGDFLSGRQRQRLLSPLQSQHREDFAATSWIGWPRTTRSSSWWTGTTSPCYRRTARRPGCVPSLLLLVLLFLLQQPLLVLGSGVFELRLGSFSNPSNRDSHGSCCSTGLPPATEGTPCPGSPCRVSFRVCLKHYQKTVDTDSPCTYGELSTPVLVQSESDGAIFNASRPPIRFPFEFSWPGTFSLIIEAWHEGPAPAGGSASSGVHRTLVAQMSTQKWLDVGDSWTPGTLQKERAALSYSYRVRCQEYYYGSDCAKLCRPRDDKFGHYKCSASGDVVCLPGWKGDYCTKAICLKGCKEPQGDCDRPNECKCRIGWEGPLCDRCVRYPGCLHGTCSQPWQCNCDEGWGGLFCNQDLNYCTNNRPCRHGGTCTNTGQGSYTCSCLPGYAGTDCEIVQDPCLASPCQNGGICRAATDSTASSNHGYTCSCPPGLGGRHCEVPHSACDSSPCMNGGSCREAPDTSDGYRCLCPDAFAGDQCEVQRDPCEPSPCANGGTCVTLSDGNPRGDGGSEHRFRCECRPGFEGPLCQTNIDDCVSNPCLNGGTCLDGADSFRCLCRPGFLGQLCDHDVDDCLTYPCANGGRCVDLVNDFACNCPAGFSGKDCSVNLDECASSPCLNGGVCVDLAGRFECRCPDDFGGDRCEHRPPALAPRVAVVPPSPGRSSARRGGEDMGRHDLLTREGSRDRGYEEELSGVQLALIVTASVTVPLVALVAALVIVCQRRRWKERRDAEAARRQNERNAVQHQGMNNKGAGGKAPPPVVVVNALVEKPLQKKANGDNNASSSSSTSAPSTTGTAKVLNVDARAQSKLSLDVDTVPEGVYASTRTLNRLYQEPGGGIEGGATVAVQQALERASLRGSSPKSCDSRVVDVVEGDDIASIKQQLHQQPQPVTGGSNAVYVIEDHYRDENLLATEV